MAASIPTVTQMTITPDLAQQWLNKNPNNRKLRISRVQKYADDLLNGRWQMNGETFKLSSDGTLMDGQHRCHAIIASGVPITAFVVENLEPDVQITVDSGASRSGADALAFAGELPGSAKIIAAGLKSWHSWLNGAITDCYSQTGSQNSISNTEIVELWQLYPEVAQAALESRTLYGAGLKLPTGSTTIALVLTQQVDAGMSAEFFRRLATMQTSGVGDPIRAVLSRVNQTKNSMNNSNTIKVSTGLFILLKAWNCFVQGKPLSKFYFGNPQKGWTPIPTVAKPSPMVRARILP